MAAARPLAVGLALAALCAVPLACDSNNGKAQPNHPAPAEPTSPTRPAEPVRDAPIVLTDQASAESAVGQRGTATGVAQNAKLGPVIVQGDLVVYCETGQDSWSEQLLGASVTGAGVIDIADASSLMSEDGAIRAGTSEPRVVLLDCQADLAE